MKLYGAVDLHSNNVTVLMDEKDKSSIRSAWPMICQSGEFPKPLNLMGDWCGPGSSTTEPTENRGA
jgi:hypothetical protein